MAGDNQPQNNQSQKETDLTISNGNNKTGEGEEESVDKQHQNHCDNCFSPTRCLKYRSLHKNDPNIGLITCPIMTCTNKCGLQFHECKKTEHELLCERAKVSCINKEFGCPFLMERSQRAKHLASCPASVVVCTMEWNRWPLPPGKCQPFAMDQDHLDVCATMLDQQTVKLWKEKIPSSLKTTLKTYMNERHPVMPLGVSGHRIPKCIIDAKQMIPDPDEISESPDTTEHDESSDSPWGSKKAPPGLQESVCYKLKALTFDNGSGTSNGTRSSPVRIVNELLKNPQELNNKGETGGGNEDGEDQDLGDGSVTSSAADLLSCDNNDGWECDLSDCLKGYETPEVLLKDKSNSRKGPLLNLTVEIISKYQCKPNSMYSFICAREFRRDEYLGHFKHFHTEIHTQLNGWLFQRCPMANLGCSFGIHRLFPFDQNHRIVFNNALSTFSHTTVKGIDSDMQNGNEEDCLLSLLSLPFEILVHITKFLDPLSLNSLAQVNGLLEDVCRDRLLHRGIVVLNWEKATDKPGWIVKEHKWMYSVSFSPITNWTLGNVGRMANHMKSCPCFERNIPSRPFSYHTMDLPANDISTQVFKKEL